MPERATVMSRSEKSAEAEVVADKGRRAKREGASNALSMSDVVHQMPAQRGGLSEGEVKPCVR